MSITNEHDRNVMDTCYTNYHKGSMWVINEGCISCLYLDVDIALIACSR